MSGSNAYATINTLNDGLSHYGKVSESNMFHTQISHNPPQFLFFLSDPLCSLNEMKKTTREKNYGLVACNFHVTYMKHSINAHIHHVA